jgi:hypothetical protein
VSGDHSDDRLDFFTILDNVLTIGESASGKEQAGRPQPQSGGLPEGAGGGMQNGAAANFAVVRVLQKNVLTLPVPTLKKAKNKGASI